MRETPLRHVRPYVWAFMRSIWATRANSYFPVYPSKFIPALISFGR